MSKIFQKQIKSRNNIQEVIWEWQLLNYRSHVDVVIYKSQMGDFIGITIGMVVRISNFFFPKNLNEGTEKVSLLHLDRHLVKPSGK